MSDYQGLYKDSLPVAFVVCNLNSPSEGKPALFDFDEIVTIFHEFGHALHHLLTKVQFPCAAGISGVPWDGFKMKGTTNSFNQLLVSSVFEAEPPVESTSPPEGLR